jgi:lipopolysaccharide biosynthesis protein
MVKALAYYLPQFHRIPENDEWWGEGFTEWVNVKAGRQTFEGHLQPRQPTELGYYDLSDPSVLPKQIELAKSHGIHGFCYYMYWFGNGRQLLEKPLEMMLADKSLNMPFCLFWANKSWTRAWTRRENSILQDQTYPPEDTRAFAEYLVRFFRDERYIRIGGAPVFVLYRARDFFDDMTYLQRLQDNLKDLGIPEVKWIICTVRRMSPRWGKGPYSLGVPLDFPTTLLLDRSVEREGSAHQDYKTLIQTGLSHYLGHKVYRTVMTGFDDTPRRPARGTVIVNSTPDLYAQWLDQICRMAAADFPKDEQFVFLYAWNEWGEGGYLEPDVHFGRGFLEATRDVMAKWRGEN